MNRALNNFILLIALLVIIAVYHQMSIAEPLPDKVQCKLLVMDVWTDETGFEHSSTKLAKVTGYTTQVLNENYFVADFTNDMQVQGLAERFNAYVQTPHIDDCGLGKLGASQSGGGSLEARFPGDSENF